MWASIEQTITAIQQGRMVIVVDHEDRENEGDLVAAAATITPEQISFMARWGGGIICAPITPARAQELQLPLMVPHPQQPSPQPATAASFTVSIDLKEGNTTGASAFDRARTARALICPHRRPEDFVRPGHLFPLIAHPQGVLGRAGHTEAAVELAALAGLSPASVICEIMDNQGRMARKDHWEHLAREFQLPILSMGKADSSPPATRKTCIMSIFRGSFHCPLGSLTLTVEKGILIAIEFGQKAPTVSRGPVLFLQGPATNPPVLPW